MLYLWENLLETCKDLLEPHASLNYKPFCKKQNYRDEYSILESSEKKQSNQINEDR